MSENNRNGVPSSPDHQQSGPSIVYARSGLSVSRQVKIGLVLMLMCAGYFLIDDSPRPAVLPVADTAQQASNATDMQEFMDDLQFVEPSGMDAPPSSAATSRPLRLPASPSRPAAVTVASTSAHQQTFDRPHISVPHEQAIQPEDTQHAVNPSSFRTPQVTIRFTGRIEPLR